MLPLVALAANALELLLELLAFLSYQRLQSSPCDRQAGQGFHAHVLCPFMPEHWCQLVLLILRTRKYCEEAGHLWANEGHLTNRTGFKKKCRFAVWSTASVTNSEHVGSDIIHVVYSIQNAASLPCNRASS